MSRLAAAANFPLLLTGLPFGVRTRARGGSGASSRGRVRRGRVRRASPVPTVAPGPYEFRARVARGFSPDLRVRPITRARSRGRLLPGSPPRVPFRAPVRVRPTPNYVRDGLSSNDEYSFFVANQGTAFATNSAKTGVWTSNATARPPGFDRRKPGSSRLQWGLSTRTAKSRRETRD